MNSRVSVLVVGDTVLMEGVALTLRENHAVSVDQSNPEVADIKSCATLLKPDVIVFEMGSPLSFAVLSLLCDLPGTQLLAVDLTSDRMVVMNSKESRARSMLELHLAFEDLLGDAALAGWGRCESAQQAAAKGS